MIINHNMSSLYATRQEGLNTKNVQGNMEKISSGLRINKAGDDSAGLSISEKMRSQIRGLNQASKNISDASSFVNVTEGHLNETTDILQRIRELAVQSSNGIYSESDRAMLQTEVSSLVDEVSRVASQAQFNGMNMLTGRFANEGITFHIGANSDQNVSIKIGSVSAEALGLKSSQGVEGESSKISIATADSANAAINVIDTALDTVNKQRADLGAAQNKFDMAKKGVDIASENLVASESRIRDTDIAKEYTDFVKNQILQQASTAMTAQAMNTSREAVRGLLG